MEDLLHELLDRYDTCLTECDGHSRIVSYVLTANNIPHTCYVGRVRTPDDIIMPHFWVQVGILVIDYRLRMWLGGEAPHGIFELGSNNVTYQPEKELRLCPYPSTVFYILTGGMEVANVTKENDTGQS